jgi:hypothetical protein
VARALVMLSLLSTAGCFPLGSSSSDGGGPRAYGYQGPTVELTINGLHFGPSAPDATAGADFSAERDPQTGNLQQATLRVHATSATTGASCQIIAERFGDGIGPLGVGTYNIAPPLGSETPDGTVSPVSGELVSVPQGSWQCGQCDGVVLGITYLGQDHIEGYLSGMLDNTAGAPAASVVCSFYVPMRSYSP